MEDKKGKQVLLEKEEEEKDQKRVKAGEEKGRMKIKRRRNLQFEVEDILRTDIKTFILYNP